MNDNELDNKVREYYMKQELPASSIQRILEQGKVEKEKGPEPEVEEAVKGVMWRQWATVAVAACFMLIIALQFAPPGTPKNDIEEVAGVVASRHNNFASFDFSVNSFEEVQSELSDLAFTVQPVVKQKLLSAYEVIGARYCQVQGQQTAHLQVRNRSTGVLCSLFIASIDGALEGMDSADHIVDLEANHIDMWSDSGRFYALVN